MVATLVEKEKDQVSAQIIAELAKECELDETITKTLQATIESVLSNFHVLQLKQSKRRQSGGKVARKSSGYNLFVKEKMQDPSIKELNHKEKMTQIGQIWKTLSADEKAKYKGDSAPVVAEAKVEAPVAEAKKEKKSAPKKSAPKKA